MSLSSVATIAILASAFACTRAPSEALDTRLSSPVPSDAPSLAVDTRACSDAYVQTNAAMANMPKDLDTGQFPPLKPAPREVFMRDCLRLPPLVQKCLGFGYTAEHMSECEAARAQYDASVAAGVR
ncbi:MAG: hypothetical protein K0R38_589 [Polyangiaceae bacterium]|jgi:hypothetical protein|nr:hypothetical protein [Polyangiaceae bacterium]